MCEHSTEHMPIVRSRPWMRVTPAGVYLCARVAQRDTLFANQIQNNTFYWIWLTHLTALLYVSDTRVHAFFFEIKKIKKIRNSALFVFPPFGSGKVGNSFLLSLRQEKCESKENRSCNLFVFLFIWLSVFLIFNRTNFSRVSRSYLFLCIVNHDFDAWQSKTY